MSTLRVTTIQNTAGVTQYLARAWVNFNGTGTVAVRGSGNVSSITDNGVGSYTVNFTTAMSDGNYGIVAAAGFRDGVAGRDTAMSGVPVNNVPTTTAVSVRSSSGAGADADAEYISVAIFR